MLLEFNTMFNILPILPIDDEDHRSYSIFLREKQIF